VWQEEDLTGTYPVAKNGTLTLNWVEPIAVESLTLEEAKEKIGCHTETVRSQTRGYDFHR